MQPGSHKKLNRWGKKAAPALSRVLNRSPMVGLVSMISWYLAFIQGKGSGAGWDLEAEIKGALSAIRRDSHESLVLFDVGANVGDWTEGMLAALGDGCAIYQFEPTLECREILLQKSRPNVVLVPYGVGAEEGEAEIYSISGVKAKSASLYARKDTCFEDRSYTKETIRITTIDDFVDQNNMDRIDFMKMDIEGHEYAALKGAVKTLERGAIAALTFEFGTGNINSRTYFRDFWDLLTPLGYRISRI
ncbi:SAM-dependent methyltransferases [Thiohalobacter thiocyanaticus]|uniref:SAM-dependent methyltransferases n=1 Tax=Thiohalobacter thiocyanaticus TaxID=585455 RepID=A0A1Z4VMZ0_9GAMM|nr:FkbM family methyltransferase [Thiohalobacter thiocyanaticus]BAZ92981.1 SAM-dependent methyltransferases [Thiohalobacter thiocyanaticus]